MKKVVVVSGFSGVGKGTILGNLVKSNSRYEIVVSYTTRNPRNETDNYIYVSTETFERMRKNGEFIECDCYAGNWYGTPFAEIQRICQEGRIPVLEININGFIQMKNAGIFNSNEIVSVFIVVPAEELYFRLINRKSRANDNIRERLEIALKEVDYLELYDGVICNWNIQVATKELEELILTGKGGDGFNVNQFKLDIEKLLSEI